MYNITAKVMVLQAMQTFQGMKVHLPSHHHSLAPSSTFSPSASFPPKTQSTSSQCSLCSAHDRSASAPPYGASSSHSHQSQYQNISTAELHRPLSRSPNTTCAADSQRLRKSRISSRDVQRGKNISQRISPCALQNECVELLGAHTIISISSLR